MNQEKKNQEEKQNDYPISVIIYYSYIYKIGGIEAWLYYMAQNLCKYYNITLLFDNGDIQQLTRINQYINVEQRDVNKRYNCDVVLFASHLNRYPNNVNANKAISVVHSDYRYYKELIDKYIIGEHADKIVCVSQHTSESLKEIFNKDGIIIPNILGKKIKTHPVLHLVSFTRLTKEKGYDRMCRLINILKENHIKFDWKIFSDIDNLKKEKIECPEVIFMKPTLDTFDYIADADYLVQLSDTEAFCYSVHEALQYGTAVLVTDLDVFKNVVQDGYNGYKINLDMSNVDDNFIEKLVNDIPKDFIYDDKHDEIVSLWTSVLGTPCAINDTNKIDKNYIQIQALEEFYDLVNQRTIKEKEVIWVDTLRAYELCTINNRIERRLCKEV